MRYPFSITFDLEIIAKSLTEAKKIAEAYAQDVELEDRSNYPEVITDQVQVGDYTVLDCDEYDYVDNADRYISEMCDIFNKVYKEECNVGRKWSEAWSIACEAIRSSDYAPTHIGDFFGFIGDTDNVRRCSVCGKPMFEGYLIDDAEYACSNDCLLDFFKADKEFTEISQDTDTLDEDLWNDRAYWTEWEEDGVFYKQEIF